MLQTISEPITVSFTFDSKERSVKPRALVWGGKLHAVSKVGLHHKFKKGRTLFHVFSVVSSTTFFRLILNTDNLHWNVEEIGDGI